VYATTKWCEFQPIDYEGLSVQDFVLKQVQERCRRLGGRAELLQLHWYDVSYRVSAKSSAYTYHAPNQSSYHAV